MLLKMTLLCSWHSPRLIISLQPCGFHRAVFVWYNKNMAIIEREGVAMFLFCLKKIWSITVGAALIVCIVLAPAVSVNGSEVEEKEYKKVLYINSYHEGYKWSDDIRTSIEAVFSAASVSVEMETYYLDTQRIPVENPEEYYKNIQASMAYKSDFLEYDLIITSDDAAYTFVLEYGDIFDDSIPHLFCGVNNPSAYDGNAKRKTGGIIEYVDYADNFELINMICPDVTEIHYIIDGSLTSKNITASFEAESQNYDHHFDFYPVETDSMDHILTQVSRLPENAVVMYNLFYHDDEGNYFDYKEGIRLISEASTVPVFGQYEFNMSNGLFGGKLASGENQGTELGTMAVRYLSGDEFVFETIFDNRNRYQFDYTQMLRFGVSTEDIPTGSDVINFKGPDKKEILILHSYNMNFSWTARIDEGIRKALSEMEDGSFTVYTDYMDLKNASGSVYMSNYQKVFREKYSNRSFDLILTSDDGAFDFAMDFVSPMHSNAQIVFSGVNYLEPEAIAVHDGYTGVMEAYDIIGTIEGILALQPEVDRVLVINDTSQTGVGNRKNIENIEGRYEGELTFEHIEPMTMTELLDLVARQDDRTAILLMTFNRDRASNRYSYAQSIELIYSVASVPMYGVWDFYLGDGLIGGYLTDGMAQGELAGALGRRILAGEMAGDLRIITESPNGYAFDAAVMERFDIDLRKVPKGSMIVNKDGNFIDLYSENNDVFNLIFLVIGFTVVVIMILILFLRNSVKMNRKIQELATFDHLTGVYNRGAGIKAFETYIGNPRNKGKEITICFMDLNRLKEVNDRFGHSEGDQLILAFVEVVKSMVKNEDIFCRMGGDEFMVVLIGAGREVGQAFKQQLTERLHDRSKKSGKDYEYSVSIGLNHFTAKEETDITYVIEQADTLMYRDKAIYRKSKRI